jgi:hypothetical protein
MFHAPETICDQPILARTRMVDVALVGPERLFSENAKESSPREPGCGR